MLSELHPQLKNLFYQHRYRNSVGSHRSLTEPKRQLEAIKALSIVNCKAWGLVLGAHISRYNLHVRKMFERNR